MINSRVNRTPSTAVRRNLRREVNFGCPVPDGEERCGNPYLTWHHFDPPWSVRQHHDPSGMIALCRMHHDKADAGAYTKEQLIAFKNADGSKEVVGRFDWMRRNLLVSAGRIVSCKARTLEIKGRPVIWANRDLDGNFLLNVKLPDKAGKSRLLLEDNFWRLIGDPTDFECPPHGRLISVTYPDGDHLRIEFNEACDRTALAALLPNGTEFEKLAFPILVASVQLTIAWAGIRLDDSGIHLGNRHVNSGRIYGSVRIE
jgi:hypothetical protein